MNFSFTSTLNQLSVQIWVFAVGICVYSYQLYEHYTTSVYTYMFLGGDGSYEMGVTVPEGGSLFCNVQTVI